MRKVYFVKLWILSLALFSRVEARAQTEKNIIQVPAITVEGKKIPQVSDKYKIETNKSIPYKDSADAISSLPGVVTSRIGGHGTEITIRGQQQNQLNIISHGTYTFGGCPNRMDPPTSYLQLESADSLEIIRGYQTVEYGFGGTGGSLVIKSDYFDLLDQALSRKVMASMGHETNPNLKYINLSSSNFITSDKKIHIKTNGGYKTSSDFKNGYGKEIRSSFEDLKLNLSSTWFDTKDSRTTVMVDKSEINKAKFEGTSMDAPVSKSMSLNVEREIKKELGLISKYKYNFYYSDVDHIMDNYSLRPNVSNSFMRVDSVSNTYGFKFVGHSTLLSKFGLEYMVNFRDAKRYSGFNSGLVETKQSYLWPKTIIDQKAIFAETVIYGEEAFAIVLGGRYEYVKASAQSQNEITGAVSPYQLYSSVYEEVSDKQVYEHNFNALIRNEWRFDPGSLMYLGVNRSLRSADSTERYIAINSSNASQKWIGNPNLKPEVHLVYELGLKIDNEERNYFTSVYVDEIENYIFRDTAKGQDGVKVQSQESIYRNIKAQIAGIDFGGLQKLGNFKLGINVNFTRGENKEKAIPLAQISPLMTQLTLDYEKENFSLGLKSKYAARQDRVDTDSKNGSGRDKGVTSSWETLDFSSTIRYDKVLFLLGIKNIFNRNYYQHINKPDVASPGELQVHEPGRSYYVQGSIEF